MARLGELLRAQREKKGITLDQAAADTRIREKFLKALEDADYQSLPGAVYTKGFLRNYAGYLDLDQDDVVVMFHQERGTVAADPRTFEPMRPLVRRSLIFTPAVLVPVVVLAGIVLFVGYLYYQFTSFAVPPALDVTDPSTDAIVQDGKYVIKGQTVPGGRVTVQVFPGPLTIADIHPAADGTFTAAVELTQGANHVIVEVLDQSGKVSRVSRSILLQPQVAATSAPPLRLTVEQPANGMRVDNASVHIVGVVDTTATALTINGTAIPINPGGRFDALFNLPAGQQTLTVVARNTAGTAVTETRAVTVAYTAAVVMVFVTGGDAWVQATVDGTVVAGTGRVYREGENATFVGRQVVIRTGNAVATKITFNGNFQGPLGGTGEVVEKVYTAP